MRLRTAFLLFIFGSITVANADTLSSTGTSAARSDLGSHQLLDDANLAQNVGKWESEFFVRDRSGNLINRFKAEKNIQVFNNIYYQVNTYWYDDGTVRSLRFIGVPRKDGGFETDSPDRKYFKRLQRVAKSVGPNIAIWTLRDRRTGQDLGAEFITTFGDKRTATPHFYEISEERRKELGIQPDDPPIGRDATTTIIEKRIAQMVTDQPVFTMTEAEKRGLLPIFHPALGID